MFMIHAEPPANSSAKEENCLVTKGKDLSQLWHRRLGHLSYIMLKQLGSKGMVQGLPLIENVFDVCKDCLVEAVNWSNYVLNRCPNAALKDITPEEAWSGNRPSISHMRVFGCLANVHIPKQQRKKLNDRSVESVFLGFSDEFKAYKLLNPKTNKIIVSRDVIFQEDKGWDWSKTHLEDGLIDLEWDDEVNSNRNNEGDDVAVIPEEEDVIATNEEDVYVMNNTHHGRVNTRSGRSVQAPVWMNNYVSAIKRKHWRTAMMDEIKSIEKNNTWSLVELPKGAKTVGVKNEAGNLLIVSIYVDDLIYTGDNETILKNFKASMMKLFEMTDLGIMIYFLGIEVLQGQEGNFICQKRYAKEVLKRFGMSECKAVKTPIARGTKLNKDESGVAVSESYYKQIVGCLMYLTATRPDIMYAVSLVSRYMSKPTEMHM
nr:putative RNA-directed DNA polymerase [Tanacetum cinerariifolium]